MIVGGQAAAAQSQLNFSRDMEREADRVGFGVLSQAGFEPRGFVTMFEKLQQASRLNDSGGFPYLRSHPLTTERMSDMQSRLPQGNPSLIPSTPLPVDWVHAMVSARARVLSNANVDGLRAWTAQVGPAELAKLTAPAQVAALYGATLAALKLRDYALAQAVWLRLEAQTRSNAAAARTTALLGSELALAQGTPTRVQTLLQGLPDTDRAVLFLHAQASVAMGKTAPVAQALQTWLADHPRDAQAWQWLAQAHAVQGKAVAAIRAQAEASVAQWDYAAALEQLKAAQNLARQSTGATDHIESSILDTRTRQLELLLREQALER
jgi:predicted Zn-dependent protease